MERLNRLGNRMSRVLGAARESWALVERDIEPDAAADHYAQLWALYTGTAFSPYLEAFSVRHLGPLYKNTRLLWKDTKRVVDFYAMTVYSGTLSTDGEPLPDGTMGAIPIDGQTGDETKNAAILVAAAELYSAWNWQRNMTKRPRYGAALGSVLTELRDDLSRGMVYPHHVWPAFVKDLDLDPVGAIKSYALEYTVQEEETSYTFRKEVTKKAYRYFRDGEPFLSYPGGPVQPNPYGFIPAHWDQHTADWGTRGMSAIEDALQALYELNSLFSTAFDAQKKTLLAPIIVQGSLTAGGDSTVSLAGGARDRPSDNTVNAQERQQIRNRQARQVADSLRFMQAAGDVSLHQARYDLGDTLEVLKEIRDGILDEHPEASFYQQLREMRELTGPGAERALGDAVSRVRMARSGYDPGTVSLTRMAIAMIGHRVNNGDYERAQGRPTSKRQEAFRSFTLESYAAGDLDFTIADRPVIWPTEAERLELIRQRAALRTPWEMEEAGIDKLEVARILRERKPVKGTQEYADWFGKMVSALSDLEDSIESDYAYTMLGIPAGERQALRDGAEQAADDAAGPLFPPNNPLFPVAPGEDDEEEEDPEED